MQPFYDELKAFDWKGLDVWSTSFSMWCMLAGSNVPLPDVPHGKANPDKKILDMLDTNNKRPNTHATVVRNGSPLLDLWVRMADLLSRMWCTEPEKRLAARQVYEAFKDILAEVPFTYVVAPQVQGNGGKKRKAGGRSTAQPPAKRATAGTSGAGPSGAGPSGAE